GMNPSARAVAGNTSMSSSTIERRLFISEAPVATLFRVMNAVHFKPSSRDRHCECSKAPKPLYINSEFK
ncbi:MAG TPA: hypothetical protein PLC40_20225, partial [Candidatus Hydrogenedentes bacterium]|nr:hypothetical protein [Candidatus Hydrogenedentota bacterium]